MMPNSVWEYISMHFNPDLSALDRLNLIVRLIHQDDVAVSLLEKLLESAEQYFCRVFEMESRMKVARLRLEEENLRELTELLDKNRTFAHESLIANLHIFNRYILKEFEQDIPIGGIFSKPPEAIRDRIAVADWAGELLAAVYQERRR